MVAAIFGLVGVLLGSLLSTAKDFWFQRLKYQKEREYLAAIVSCALESYVQQCADAVGDDGLYQGQTDPEGNRYIQTDTPTFSPESFNVEWKSLPSSLMYQILMLPNQGKAAERIVSDTYATCCSPLTRLKVSRSANFSTLA